MTPRHFASLFHAALWCALAAASAPAQIPNLKTLTEGTSAAAPATTDSPADERTRLEKWQRDARETLAKLDSAIAANSLPPGIGPVEIEDRRRDLAQIILTSTRSIKSLGAIEDARKALEAARAEAAAWTAFKEPPPYSILLVDELLTERDATKRKLASHQASLSNYQRLLADTLAETKASEEVVSTRLLAVQQADDSAAPAAKWRLEAARNSSRLLAARAGFIQTSCEELKDRIAAAEAELELVDRKVAIAGADPHFNDEDIARLTQIGNDRKTANARESKAFSLRLKAAMSERSQARAALDSLDPEPIEDADKEALDVAKLRSEVADSRVEILQNLIEDVDSLSELEDFNLKTYQDRRAYLQASSPADRKKALEALTVALERIRAWENVIDNRVEATSAELSKLESRASSAAVGDPRFNLLNEQRALVAERLALSQRIAKAVVAQRKLIKRWVLEYTPDPSVTPDISERVSTLGTTLRESAVKLWALKVMTFEDKVEVDGETITGEIPVTVGMLLRALLFFIIGYFVALRIAHHIQRGLVARGFLAVAQANTLKNWVMILVGFFLVLGTLAFLKIPLTVFAFFGGALAIGLGFGTQTLIKNFISGIIVLAERKIRVGDVLELDGIVGTVTEINTRSSVIRSADELETMIPNSAFLENRVTNWTLSSSKVRRFVRLGVAYGSSPRQVMDVLTESAARHQLVCKDPAPFAVFEDFGDSALIFCLYFWLEVGGSTNRTIVGSDLRLMIEKRFSELGIGVPFPQRDVNLNSASPITVRIAPEEP